MNNEVPSIEKNNNLEKNGKIDLSKVEIYFCDDETIVEFYDKKLEKLRDKNAWIEENEEKLIMKKESIDEAIRKGIIADGKIETIWRKLLDNEDAGLEKILSIKKEVEIIVKDLMGDVSDRLGEFLPDWQADNLEINFTMNEKADFCIDYGVITVDLGRLLFADDLHETIVAGVAHEVFHHWMGEDNWSDSEQEKASDQELREHIMRKTIDEGLAVLVADFSLKDHHEKRGMKYDEYIVESFAAFDEFLKENNRGKLDDMYSEKFKNMGHFYVVGNEMAKTILREMGLGEFRKLIVEARKDPEVFLQKYNEIKS